MGEHTHDAVAPGPGGRGGAASTAMIVLVISRWHSTTAGSLARRALTSAAASFGCCSMPAVTPRMTATTRSAGAVLAAGGWSVTRARPFDQSTMPAASRWSLS